MSRRGRGGGGRRRRGRSSDGGDGGGRAVGGCVGRRVARGGNALAVSDGNACGHRGGRDDREFGGLGLLGLGLGQVSFAGDRRTRQDQQRVYTFRWLGWWVG
jgi:hypothetical protein